MRATTALRVSFLVRLNRTGDMPSSSEISAEVMPCPSACAIIRDMRSQCWGESRIHPGFVGSVKRGIISNSAKWIVCSPRPAGRLISVVWLLITA